ncbi:Flp family type IVb pilin [Bosea sp. (in: a-proteobacteria)]|uniref:Flp family type IVb pilin n=1 Tax=Bosea sp. (in: a-proteobacteria) TaxID=1871050 RepID=UPI001D9300D2|nr:Flp family type IVb pilin [Bosea sp. (in: a-proteobacteria)]MBA4221223.1 Flp family type IVb pilin [Methylobacterium sp.]MBR3192265.1 Flp family type IVb pilin [Bosea sp. (in: a-proteobacteria)]
MERFCALALDFLRDRRGATAIEYAFIASLISIAAVAALLEIGPSLNAKFTGILPSLQ